MVYSKTLPAGSVNCVGECVCDLRKISISCECRTQASTVLSLVYDLPPVTSVSDPTVTKVNQFADQGTRYAVPGNYLVEFFTWMKHIPSPLAKWKREAEKGFEEYSEFFGDMFRKVENRIVRAPVLPFFGLPSHDHITERRGRTT